MRGRLGCRVKQAYGMTEFGGATHIVPDTGGGDAESVGPLLPGNQSRVVDSATGLDVGPGQPGEMLIRSPGTMSGYLNNPAATAATIDAAAGCIPGTWSSPTGRAGSGSSTGSKISSSTRATRWLLPCSRRCCWLTPRSPMPP